MVDKYINACCKYVERFRDRLRPYFEGISRMPDLMPLFQNKINYLKKEIEDNPDSNVRRLERKIFFLRVCQGVCVNLSKESNNKNLVSKVGPAAIAS